MANAVAVPRQIEKRTRSALYDAAFKAVGAPADRIFQFTFSDGTVDRVGDTIAPDGWNLEHYLKNPVVLYAHDGQDIPIGQTVKVWVEGDALKGLIGIGTEEVDELVYRKICAGELRAVSVGFLPLESEYANDDARPYGVNFTKQELLEMSVVPVPANRNALIEPRTKTMGIPTKTGEGASDAMAGHVKTLGEHVEKMGTHIKDMGEMAEAFKGLLGADAIAPGEGGASADKAAVLLLAKNAIVAALKAANADEATVKAALATLTKGNEHVLSPEQAKCVKAAHKALSKSLNLHHTGQGEDPAGGDGGGKPEASGEGDDEDEDDKKALATLDRLSGELSELRTGLTGRL